MRGRSLVGLGIGLLCVGGIATAVVLKSRGSRGIEHGARIEYSMDLDSVVDDRASDIAHDLEARLAEQRITAKVTRRAAPAGAITVTVEPARRAEVADFVRSEYRDSVEVRDCGVDAGPGAVCMVMSNGRAIEEAALDMAVDTIRRRIDGADGAGVYKRGDRIIVELPGDAEELAMWRDLIVRTGKLELKVVDDGSSPGASGRGSPFMMRLFAHVGAMSKQEALAVGGKEGDPTDPAAKQAGVYAEQDYWRPEDGGPHSDFYLKAFDQPEVEMPLAEAKRFGCFPKGQGETTMCSLTGRQTIERYLAQLAASDSSFKVPDDRQIAYELVEPLNGTDRRRYWRSYYLFREARLTGRAIATATGSFEPSTDRPIVMLELTREGGRVFGDLTASIAGQKIATMLDGKVKSAPVVNGAIRGGRVSITMGGADPDRMLRERDDLVAVLKVGSLPAPLREESFQEIGAR